ncbi:MAG: hypothetical protein DRN88_01300 [Candidatus Hydrothermarchaeota archaeon]|nr:MAG: hypothetical protein DRN88_01300 [Candidatus Hydrothermarchaeota archaeon]
MRPLLFILLVSIFLSPVLAEESCVFCHGNYTKMQELGFPQFHVTNQDVWNQSGMFRLGIGGPRCYDCHLGDKDNFTVKGSHKGVLKLLVISMDRLLPVDRHKVLPSLIPQQKRIPSMLLPRGKNIKTLLYHDRDPRTLAYSIEIANKTCGKCHVEEVKSFSRSNMGVQNLSRRYSSFTSPAPHNCGYWNHNYSIMNELTVEYTKEQVDVLQRKCEQCHTSCLDCHYAPFEAKHKFRRIPSPRSCSSGGGRGICHNGAEEHRRGAGYFREEASLPYLPSDVHVKLNLTCLDCHKFENHEILRKADCKDCHKKAEEELKKSVHSKLSCEACHITKIGGYQLVFWAPGVQFGIATPLAKIIYYGKYDLPLLIKDENGIWVPVKPVPHAVENINACLPETKVSFRDFPDRSSRDAYAIEACFNNTLFWIHMDKCSHGLREARNCSSCHSGEQKIISTWSMEGVHYPIKKPFAGKTIVVGNSSGLFIKIFNITEISKEDLTNAWDFAPWITHSYWKIEGDFSIVKKSDKCRENCAACHIPYPQDKERVHLVINPKAMRIKPYLEIVFIIAMILAIVIILKA